VQRRRREVDRGQPRLGGAGHHPVPDAHQSPICESLQNTESDKNSEIIQNLG
jgi:hypothetical protein